MLDKMTNQLGFQGNALILRAERQRIIASNIANADTPGYVARDLNFKEALTQMTQTTASELTGAGVRLNPGASGSASSHRQHIALGGVGSSQLAGSSSLAYAIQSQPSVDSNSVDMDRERANFVDNSVRYESTLRFINGSAKGILSAIQGQ